MLEALKYTISTKTFLGVALKKGTSTKQILGHSEPCVGEYPDLILKSESARLVLFTQSTITCTQEFLIKVLGWTYTTKKISIFSKMSGNVCYILVAQNRINFLTWLKDNPSKSLSQEILDVLLETGYRCFYRSPVLFTK